MNKDKEKSAENSYVRMLKKVGEVLKRGVVRGEQEYTMSTALTVNCMGHSFFNFENKDIEEISKEYDDELRDFFWLFERFKMFQYHLPSKLISKKVEKDLADKMALAGLEIEECEKDDEVEDGQYKVAYYFKFKLGREDFHFMRQEKDGTWSSKMGASMGISKYNSLPRKFNDYKLIKIFKVTNPYIYKEEEKEWKILTKTYLYCKIFKIREEKWI